MIMAEKVILITGATRGIGKAVASLLSQKGMTVIKAGRSAGDYVFDIKSELQVRNEFSKLKKKVSHVDALVHCAGVMYPGELTTQSIEKFKDTLDTNVLGTAIVTKYTLPLLEAAKAPLIILLSSGSAYTAKAGLSAYCASKFAIRGLAESWHFELKSKGIRVSMITPGKVNTDMHTGTSSEFREKMLNPSDIAQCVFFLIDQKENVWIKELQIRPFSLE